MYIHVAHLPCNPGLTCKGFEQTQMFDIFSFPKDEAKRIARQEYQEYLKKQVCVNRDPLCCYILSET